MTFAPADQAGEAANEEEMRDDEALEAHAFRVRALELVAEGHPLEASWMRMSAASIERALLNLPELSG